MTRFGSSIAGRKQRLPNRAHNLPAHALQCAARRRLEVRNGTSSDLSMKPHRRERLSADVVAYLLTVSLIVLECGWIALLGYGLWRLTMGNRSKDIDVKGSAASVRHFMARNR